MSMNPDQEKAVAELEQFVRSMTPSQVGFSRLERLEYNFVTMKDALETAQRERDEAEVRTEKIIRACEIHEQGIIAERDDLKAKLIASEAAYAHRLIQSGKLPLKITRLNARVVYVEGI